MSVLIKGMHTPKNCSDCPLNYDMMSCGITGTRWWSDTMVLLGFNCDEERLNNCPLVELPEHHGRLIDADRLMRVYEDRLEKVINRYGVDSSERGILSGAMKLLMIELGIVEAE